VTKEEIDISGNGLEAIPEELFKLRYIKAINAGFNLLKDWDDVPMQLEKLVINDNKFLDITGYVTQMMKLKWLDLSNNVIPIVSPLHRVQSIEYLFMRQNKVNLLSSR
jgi:Leucine-rich repeat (LRR) protein